MFTLRERRAYFVYGAAQKAAQAAHAPSRMGLYWLEWNQQKESFRKEFRELVDRQCGEQRARSPEELRRTWPRSLGSNKAMAKALQSDTHRGQCERDRDVVFLALCEIARCWVYDA